jgi:hypothetical protein
LKDVSDSIIINLREASRVPEFSVDLLKAVRATIESIAIEYMQRKPGSERVSRFLL